MPRMRSYDVLKKIVFQNFTAEFAESAEKILKNSAFSCVLSSEKDLRHDLHKISTFLGNAINAKFF